MHSVYTDIVNELQRLMAQRDAREKEYQRMKRISECSHDPSDKALATEKYREMEKTLHLIRDGTLLSNYVKTVLPLVQEYRRIAGSSRVFGMDTCTNIPKRVYIIIEFLRTSAQYVELTWDCSYNLSRICPKCHSVMKKCSPVMLCALCGYSCTIVKVPTLKIDGGHVRSESTYKASKNYKKEFLHICGSINNMRPKQKENVESYLYRAGIHTPTHDDIRGAMTACGYNNYNDTNYLHHLITLEPLPTLDKHTDVFVSRFEEYFDVFESLRDREGRNITNIHFLTKLFAIQENIPYRNEWFRTLSDNTESKHKRNARKVCNILKMKDPTRNWNYPKDWDSIPDKK